MDDLDGLISVESVRGDFLGNGMPYQVRAGSVTAVVANEKQALDMLRRLAGSGNGATSIKDIFGSEVDVATLESKMADETASEL
jgi:hypothetical protein